MVRLSKMTGPDDAEVLVKFEASESGGSIKTSHGYNMTPPRSSDGLMARTV
jgi:cysteine synthase A